MQRDLRKFLSDIQQCITEINQFTAGKTLEDYEQNVLVRKAVERDFTIIAEAIRRISKISPQLRERIDHIREIAGFRNVIVHQYDDLDDAYVWKTVTDSLPGLELQVNAWANELDTL